MPLEPGDPAPTVSAPNQQGTEVSPSSEGPTVVYFYPKDDTPGCTTEATEFRRELETYRDAGVDVYGVSVDDVESHAAFAEQHGIEFDLLADPDGDLADAFDVDRRPGGETERTTFVVVDGEMYDVYTGVDPSGHAREVLGDLLEDGVVTLG
jgi:peroxiredoxin Q/BCP